MEAFDEKELLAIANGVDTSSNVEAELDENELLAIANGEDVSKLVSQSVAKDNSLPAEQVLGEYDTKLNPDEETQYQKWRQTLPKNLQYEGDYDLRGYWKDPETTKEAVEGDHFIDKYKKPNHPTFSNESQYAVGENAKKAGRWDGEKYIPASKRRGIAMSADEMNVPKSTILSKDEAKEKGEMNANEVAARSYEQTTGADAPDNALLAHIANMGVHIGGRLNSGLQMQAAQQLLAKSDNRSDDETRGLFSKMIFGATKYLGAGLFVDDALDEWDETEGKTYKTREERTRARNAFVNELARQFIAERTATQHNATMELENRDQGFWATVLGKGPEQVGNTLPYMLGPVGIALQFAQQSTATGVDYANDVYGFAKDGSLGVIAEGDSAGKAALKGTASGAFETASEIVGGKIAGAALKRFGEVLYKGGKVLVGKFPVISEKAGKFAETQVGHAVSKFGMGLKNLFAWTSKKLHLENPIEENIEEWETDNLNALFGTGARDSEYVNADTGAPLEAWDRIKKANSEFFDPNNLIKLNEAMLLTMGGGAFVSYMAQRGMKKQVDSFLREHKLMSEEKIASTDLQTKAQALDAWAKGLSEEEVLNKINSATSWTDKLAAKIAGEPSQAENTVTLKRHLSEMNNFNSLIERAGKIDKTIREQGGTTQRFTIQQDENGKPKFDTTIIADPVTDDNIERKEMFDADSGVTIIDANGTYVVKSLVTGEKFKTSNFNRAINAADAMAVLNQQRVKERQTKAQVIDNLLHSEAYNGRNIEVFETAEQARQSIGGDFESDAPGFTTEDGTTVLIIDNIDNPATTLAMLDKGTENDRGAFADGVNFETVSDQDSDGEVIETRIARDKVHDVAIIENPDGKGFTVFGKDVPYTNVATLEEAAALARGEKIETPKEEVITNETRANETQPQPEQTQPVVPPAGETARPVEAGEASPEVGAKVASNTFRGHEVPNSATDAQKHTLEAVFGDGKIVNISVDDKGQMRVKTVQTVNGREFYRDDTVGKDGNIIDDIQSTDGIASNEKVNEEVTAPKTAAKAPTSASTETKINTSPTTNAIEDLYYMWDAIRNMSGEEYTTNPQYKNEKENAEAKFYAELKGVPNETLRNAKEKYPVLALPVNAELQRRGESIELQQSSKDKKHRKAEYAKVKLDEKTGLPEDFNEADWWDYWTPEQKQSYSERSGLSIKEIDKRSTREGNIQQLIRQSNVKGREEIFRKLTDSQIETLVAFNKGKLDKKIGGTYIITTETDAIRVNGWGDLLLNLENINNAKDKKIIAISKDGHINTPPTTAESAEVTYDTLLSIDKEREDAFNLVDATSDEREAKITAAVTKLDEAISKASDDVLIEANTKERLSGKQTTNGTVIGERAAKELFKRGYLLGKRDGVYGWHKTKKNAEGGSDAADATTNVENKKTAQVAEKPTENEDSAAQRAEKSAHLENNLEQPETEAAAPLDVGEAKSIKKRLEKKRKRGLALTDQETALLGRAEEAIKADEKAKRDATRAITEEKAKVVEVPQFLLNKSKKVSKERIKEIEDYLKDSKHNGPSLSVAISEVEKWKKYNYKGLLYFPRFVSKIDNEIENAKKRRDKLNAATKLGNLETKMLIPQTKLNEYLKKTYSPLLEFWDSNKRKLIERPMSRIAGKRNSQMGVYGKEKAYGKGNSFGFAGRDVAVEGLNLFFDGMPASGIDGLSRDTLLRLIFGENTQEVTDEYATHNDEVLVEITKLVNGDLGGYMTAGENRSSSSENTHYNIDYTQDVNALITDFLKELSQFREYLKTNETTEERQMREYYEYEEEQRIKRNAELEKEREEEIGPIVEEYALDELSAREAADKEYAKALAYVENNATAKDIAILKPSNLLAAEEGDEIRMDHHKTKFGFVRYDAENGILYLSGFDEVETDEGTRLIPNERRFRVTEDSITEIAEEKNDTRREKGTSDNRVTDEKGASRGGSGEEIGKNETRTGATEERTDNADNKTSSRQLNPKAEQYKTLANALDPKWQAEHPEEVEKLLAEGIDASAIASNPAIKGTDEIAWPITATHIGSREDAANLFRMLSDPSMEITKIIYVNEVGQILGQRVLAVGIGNATISNMNYALSDVPKGTYGVIFSHNHPSQQGNEIRPTNGDIETTLNYIKPEVEKARLKLLDHIITDHNAYASLGTIKGDFVSEGAANFWTEAKNFGEAFAEPSVAKPEDVMNLVPYGERIDLKQKSQEKLNALAALVAKAHDKSSWVAGIDDSGMIVWVAAFPKNGDIEAFLAAHPGANRFAILNGENEVDVPAFVNTIEKKWIKSVENSRPLVIGIGNNGKLADYNANGLNDKILNAAKPIEGNKWETNQKLWDIIENAVKRDETVTWGELMRRTGLSLKDIKHGFAMYRMGYVNASGVWKIGILGMDEDTKVTAPGGDSISTNEEKELDKPPTPTSHLANAPKLDDETTKEINDILGDIGGLLNVDDKKSDGDMLFAPVEPLSLTDEEEDKFFNSVRRMAKALKAKGYNTFEDMIRTVASLRPDIYERGKDLFRRAWNFYDVETDGITIAHGKQIFGKIDNELKETTNDNRRSEPQTATDGGAQSDRRGQAERGTDRTLAPSVDDSRMGSRGSDNGTVSGYEQTNEYDGRRDGADRAQSGEELFGGGYEGDGGESDRLRTDEQRSDVRADAEQSVSTGSVQSVESTEEVTPGFMEYQPPADLPVAAPKSQSLIVESSALASVTPPKIETKPKIPDSIPSNGVLQAHQYQAVCQAVNAHNKLLPDGRRMGYFCGDGTGVGKTRTIAGVLLDAMNRKLGKGKALIVSKNSDLFDSAKSDFEPFGLADNLFELDEKGRKRLGFGNGIAFTTYDGLTENYAGTDSEGNIRSAGKRGKTTSRYAELVRWLGKDFDGVIAFDEAHSAAKDDGSGPSLKGQVKRAQAVIDLQAALPNARILYLTATSAYDAEDLRFLQRMGLWGEGTGFRNLAKFSAAINKGGLSMMEMLTQGMKARGQYCSRSISFKGVTCRREVAVMTPEQKEIYDNYRSVITAIYDKLEELSSYTGDNPAQLTKMYFGRALDLFNSVITAMKVKKAIEIGRQAIADGKSPVFQLISTNEAAKNVKNGGKKKRAEINLFSTPQEVAEQEEQDVGVKDRVISYLKGNGFPIREWLEEKDAQGKHLRGDIIPEAAELRDEMIALAETLPDVGNPIDEIVKAFQDVGISRISSGSNKNAEADAFNSGKNLALVFSGAGGTGASYHADKRFKNQRQRVQIPIEFGWEPDKFIQALGRSHRNNQVVPPEFALLTTDIAGEMRFMSTIANRVASMGAIVGGDRNSSGQVVSAADSMDNTYGRAAIKNVARNLASGQVIGDVSGIEALHSMFLNPDKIDKLDANKFLGRLQFLSVDDQNEIYSAISSATENAIAAAKADGTYDDGIRKIEANRTIVKSRQTISKGDSNTETRELLTTSEWYDSRRITHEELEKRSPQGRTVEYVRNKRSGKLYGIIQNGDRIARLAPDGSYTTLLPLERSNYETIINKDAARKEWDDEYSKLPAEVEKINHYMAGDLIPVWDKIGIEGRPFVYRGAPVGSKPFIGVHITDAQLPITLYGFGKKEEARKFFSDNAYRLATREGMKIGLTATGLEDDQPYFKRAKIGTRYVLTAFKVPDASSMAGDFIDSGWDSTWAKDESNAFDHGGTVYYREFGEDAEAAFNEIINKYGVVIYRGDKAVFESRDGITPAPIGRTPISNATAPTRSTAVNSSNSGSLGSRLGMPNMRMRVERGELIITNTDARFKNDLKLAFGGEWANRVYDGKRYVKSDLRWHKSPVGRGGWWSIPLNKVPANILAEVENDGMLLSSVAPLSSVEEMNRDGGIARLSQNPDEFKATFVYNLLRSEVMPLGDSNNTVISEKELIRRAIDDGDMTAIGELYNRYMADNAAKGGLKGLIRRAAARKGMERVMNESRIEEIASLVWAGTSVDGGYELNRSGIIADINAGNIDIYKKTGSLIPIMSEKIERILNDIAERAKYRPEMPTLDAPSRSRENESELDQQIADDSSVAEGLYGADASNEYVESADYLNTTIAEKLRDVGEVIGRPLTSSERNRLNAMDMLDELMYFLPEEYQDVLNSVLKAERERGLTVNNTYKDPNGLKVLTSSYEKAQIASGLSKRVFNARLIEARKLMNEIWENIKNGKSDDNIAIKTGELVGAEETDEELNESILEGMSKNASTSDMALAIRLLLRGESVEDVAYFFDISPAMVRAWKARARNEHLIVFPGDEAENTLGLDNFPERKAVKRGSRSGTTRKARSTAWTPDLFPSANATVNDITEEKIAEGIAAGATDEEIARDANTSPEIVKLHRIRGKSVEKTKKNTALVDYFADIRNKPKEGFLFASVAPLEQETLGIELPATVEAMGFTNAEMNKWRSEHGFTELAKRAKMSLDDLHRQGAAMANNTDEMRKMIERHERAPYAINAVDQVALGQFIVNLQNKYYELSNKKREAHDNGNEPLAIQYDTEMDEVFSWIDRAHRVNKTVGAEWGRTGRARQIAIDKAGNLADYMVSCVKAKGVSLTKSERAEAELIYRKFEEAREKHENLKLEDIISQLDALSKIRLARQQDGIKERKGKYTPENIERDYVEALAQIRYHGEHRSGGVLHGLPNGQKWIRAIEAYHLMNGEGLTNGNPDGAKMAQLVLNDILAQGVEATLWDVRQIESRMGNLIKPSQDEISKSLRDIHTQLLVEQQIEHILTTGEMPPKTGFDRDIQSAAARQLRRERDRIIREKGIDRRTYEERLKTALDSYKTRLRNQIEENEKAIADIEAGRPYTPRTNHKLTLDEEAQALKERNKELKDRIKELTDDPAKNLEKRIERALATIASNINKRMEQIARAKAGDTSVFDKREKLESPELAIARNELQKLNEELKNIKQALYPNGTDAEIAQRLNLRMIALSKQYERWNNMVVDYNAADTWEARWAAVAPSQKRPPLESEATRNMAKDRDAAHRKVLEFRKKLELEDTRGEAVKAWARFVGGTSVLARAMLDMSVAGVQGGKFLRSHPIKGVKIGWKATKAFFKQNASDALATEIANHPYFEDFKNSGGHIYAMNGLEGDAPEDFRAVEQGAPLPNGKVITADMIPGVKRSSRSFAGFLNKAALELYSDMVEAAGANGTGATAEQKKLLADFVNISLGYGYGKKNVVKKLSLIPAVIDAIAWAPRKAVAELKYATLYPLLTNWAGTRKHEISGKEIWAVDKAIGRQYLRYTLGSLAFGACIVLLAKLFNGDDDDDRNIWSDILDPRSSDFGRIRIGNTSWSVFAGNEMVWRLFARLYTGQTKTNGIAKDYKYYGVEAALDYLRGKLNPLLGAAVDYKMDKNFVGEKLSEKSAWELANDYALPLTASALYENFANNPDDPLAAIFNAIPTFFGMTSYTYERDPLARVVKQGDEAVRIARSSGDQATGERIDASLKGVRSEVYGAAKEVLELEKKLKKLKAVKDESADVKNAIKELEKVIPEKRKAAIELYHRARKSGIKWDNMGWTE